MSRKRHNEVEDIFKGVDVKNDVVNTKEYSSSEESLSSNSEDEKKFRCKQLCLIKKYKKRNVLGNGN